jgi:hypothetical protein
LKRLVALVLISPLGLGVAAQACAQFPSGQCTDKALCDSADGAPFDGVTPGDAPVDVAVDTFVTPDGNVPDGDCNGGAEDCSNGIDDNCNGLIDCADPVCSGAGYVCTPPPPSGWTLVSLGMGTTTPPACTGAYATSTNTGNTGLNAPQAMCGCACSNPPINVQCNTGVSITYYTDSCVTSYGSAGLPPNFCVNTGSSTVTHAKGSTGPTSYNGDCTATPSKSVTPPTWSNSYSACGYAAKYDTGGCMNSAQCVAPTPTGFGPKPCVYQVGDIACPTTTYTVKTTFYTSVSDNRDCATCTCSASAGVCSATIDGYNATFCGMGTGSVVGTVPTDGTCYSCPGCISSIAPTVTATPGTCGNSGTGGPTGSATEAGPVTVCCTP